MQALNLHGVFISNGGPGGIRTPDLLVRSFIQRFSPRFWFTYFAKRVVKKCFFEKMFTVLTG